MRFESSQQPVTWFRDSYRDGVLELRPPYQRKPVWAAKQKCYLVESILMRLPVPEIYVHVRTSPDGETKYAVVDGQQRIRAVLQFIGSETSDEEESYNKFSLDKLHSNSDWRNLTFAELSDADKSRFYGYMFAVRYLYSDSEDEVRGMFRRLNKYLAPLKPQELRNATYSGPFVALTLSLADNEYWVENRVVTPASIRRMGDVEFVSELLIGVLHGPQGGSPRVIDSYYEQYEDYEDEFPEQRRAKRLFEEALRNVHAILPKIRDTRWGNKTDFYTLFVALASLLRSHKLPKNGVAKVRKALIRFADEVDRRLGDETIVVKEHVIQYVRAVEKGANDKKRRGDRHVALMTVMKSHFRETGSAR